MEFLLHHLPHQCVVYFANENGSILTPFWQSTSTLQPLQANPDTSSDQFRPGLVADTSQGLEFVEGKLVKVGADVVFVPGELRGIDERFEKASNASEIKW